MFPVVLLAPAACQEEHLIGMLPRKEAADRVENRLILSDIGAEDAPQSLIDQERFTDSIPVESDSPGRRGRRLSAMDDELDNIDPPNCPNCLTRCVGAGTPSHPFWACLSCRTAIMIR